MATLSNWTNAPDTDRAYIDVTIAGGGTESDVIALKHYSVVGIQPDADFAGSAITLQTGIDDAALVPYHVDGAAFSVAVAADQFAAIKLSDSYMLTTYVKLVSGTGQGGGTPSVVRVYGQAL